jgi:cytochrome c
MLETTKNPRRVLILRLGAGLIIGLSVHSISNAQRPGDRQFPNQMNPTYSMVNLLPPGFKPQVTGMDTLSDGRLVIATREDSPFDYSPPTSGKIYIVSGYKSYLAVDVTYKMIAEGLNEPMGLVVVHDSIYTITKQDLFQFVDADKDGNYESKKSVCNGMPGTADVFEWNFGLAYIDGAFYSNLSSHHQVDNGGQNTERGGVIRMHKNNTFELLGTGIRRSNGVGLGPNNDVFTTDNQGEWVPTSRLIHAQKDKWYGYRNGPNYNPHNYPLTKPAIWMEHYAVSRSPSQPSLLIEGPYKGQMITGDCTDPNIRRMFVEKVNGEYQGAVFHFGAMDKSPANRFLMARNGDIFVGGLGSVVDSHADWNWGGGVIYGLQVLRPSQTIPFDMLAVRAVKGGFEIQFTKPVGSGAETPGNYEIKTWGYISERSYSSLKQNEYGLSVASIKLSVDRKRAFLAINDLPVGNVVYLRLREPIRSESNENPWITEAWYTLNNLGTVEPLQPLAEMWVPAVTSSKNKVGKATKQNSRVGYPVFTGGFINRNDRSGIIRSIQGKYLNFTNTVDKQ